MDGLVDALPPRGPAVARIGLTGGIGSGKSAVSRCFERLGVPVIDADRVAREVVELGQPALRRGHASARGGFSDGGLLHTARGNGARGGQAFHACAFRLRQLQLRPGLGQVRLEGRRVVRLAAQREHFSQHSPCRHLRAQRG